MSQAGRRLASQTAPPLARPLPPADGWTLMEAVEALCPEEASLFKGGGAPLEAALHADAGKWAKLLLPDQLEYSYRMRWLGRKVQAALLQRPDLVLTGHNLANGISAPRVGIPHSILLAAQPREGDYPHQWGASIDLRVDLDRLSLSYSFEELAPAETPAQRLEQEELIAVRIERAAIAGTTTLLSNHADPPIARADPSIKPVYSKMACRLWLLMRVHTWPKSEPPPTLMKCLAAARAHFDFPIGRDAFQAIRRDTVPQSWRTPGPGRKRDPDRQRDQ